MIKMYKVKFKDKPETYWVLETVDKKWISVHNGNDLAIVRKDLEIVDSKMVLIS